MSLLKVIKGIVVVLCLHNIVAASESQEGSAPPRFSYEVANDKVQRYESEEKWLETMDTFLQSSQENYLKKMEGYEKEFHSQLSQNIWFRMIGGLGLPTFAPFLVLSVKSLMNRPPEEICKSVGITLLISGVIGGAIYFSPFDSDRDKFLKAKLLDEINKDLSENKYLAVGQSIIKCECHMEKQALTKVNPICNSIVDNYKKKVS